MIKSVCIVLLKLLKTIIYCIFIQYAIIKNYSLLLTRSLLFRNAVNKADRNRTRTIDPSTSPIKNLKITTPSITTPASKEVITLAPIELNAADKTIMSANVYYIGSNRIKCC